MSVLNRSSIARGTEPARPEAGRPLAAVPMEGLPGTLSPPPRGAVVPRPRRMPPRARRTPWTQSLEPILFPKLQIQFADFPYLRCPDDQRFLTLETRCGSWYDPDRRRFIVCGFSKDIHG